MGTSLAALVAAGLACVGAAHPATKRPTADEALEQLIQGNDRFSAGAPKHRHEGAAWRKALEASQAPFATILGCSDSRVPTELVFDQGFGDLFVVRVAGNVVGQNDLGSIEYAVHHLGTPLILVLGHESCGAVTAALLPDAERQKEPEGIQVLLARMQPSIKGLDAALAQEERVHRGVEANVRHSIRQLMEAPELKELVEKKEIRIVGAVYELKSGKVRFLK